MMPGQGTPQSFHRCHQGIPESFAFLYRFVRDGPSTVAVVCAVALFVVWTAGQYSKPEQEGLNRLPGAAM